MQSPSEDDEDECIDIWQYCDLIPEADFAGFSIADRNVEMVSRTPDRKYDHVLIPTETPNVFLVIIVDLSTQLVFGHHLLNLNQKYGLETPGR